MIAKFDKTAVTIVTGSELTSSSTLNHTSSGSPKDKSCCSTCGTLLWTTPASARTQHLLVRTSLLDAGDGPERTERTETTETTMEPKPKRIKIDVACEACRRRKVKCDGARPACGNCWKRTDLRDGCAYSSEAEKPLSREKTTDGSPAEAERTLPRITRTPPEAPPPTFAPPLLPPVSSRPAATPKSTTTSSGPDPTRRGGGGGRMDRHPMTPSEASPSVVDSMTTVREDGVASGEYFGSSSAGSFTNQIKAAIDARLGSTAQAGGSRSSLFRSSLLNGGGASSIQADYVLPARKQADHLMDLYWYYVDPLYPFLDRQKFEHSYQALFAGTSLDADERVFVGTLNIVFALSTQLIESMPPDQRDSSSQGYFTRAQDLLQLSLWDTGSIELIQCLLIMSQYLQSTNNPHQTWMVVGSAVRIAQGLGLHLPETSLELTSEPERDLVTRIWHGCILMDRMIAITHGRPAMISDHLVSGVVLPAIPDSGSAGEDAGRLHRLRYQGFFVKSLELYEVINQAVLAFYSTTPQAKSAASPNHLGPRCPERHELDLGTALQLDQGLRKWEKSLPSFLTMAEPETQLDEVFKRQAVILRIRHVLSFLPTIHALL
ncbi:Sorbicillinoid biosynthetic cluster transcription factor sor3 [Colletotrichum sidae]|uniref:Sorbicillinoid biosynthetic cluster transcription factor sor3 n=1 Tax=Colletotrichum sidae TaxID=1347389 RepID=A0A4R8T891_9PEZI|nr:Sorbicillinoid biosynthetic cluster transcription factor sor3 [Colletotrichum sidae]